MHATVIECYSLGKEYRHGLLKKRRRALTDLNLLVDRGEVVGFLGHNGAGKSTTLKLLLGLVRPSEGSGRVLGYPLGSPHARAGLGYAPENPYFYDSLTAAELVSYYARLSGIGAWDAARRTRETLEGLSLGPYAGVPLRKCSKGTLQRVALAQAAIHRPKLLLLDEPMSGLDPLGRRAVREWMLEQKRQGVTIFFSTHILSDAEELCDRVAILREGRLQGVGGVESLLSDPEHRVEVRVSRGGGVERLLCAEGELWSVLEGLRGRGEKLLGVQPVRRRLEDLFTSAAGGAQ